MKRIPGNLLYTLIAIVFSFGIGHAQDNVAFRTDIEEPIYHLFSSQEYPTLALSADTLYKVFGNTIRPLTLSKTIELNGNEAASLVSEYKQVWVAKESGGAYIIDFNKQGEAAVAEVEPDKVIEHIVYNQSKTIFLKSKDSLCTYMLDTKLLSCQYFTGLLSASVTINKDSILYSDFLSGVKSIEHPDSEDLLRLRGITALSKKDESLYMLANGIMKRRLPNGNVISLCTIPDKHKMANNVFVEESLNVWVQSTDLFFFDLFDKKLNQVYFKSEEVPLVYDAIAVSDYVSIATSDGLYQYRKTVDEIVHKKRSAVIPRLYGNEKESYLLDDQDLYTSGNGLRFKKLSVNTKLKYPIHGNDAWWVNLGGKLVKVGDKSVPPIQAPDAQVNVVYEVDDKQLLIGGDEILQTYHLSSPAKNVVLSNISVLDIVLYDETIHVITKDAVYRLIEDQLTQIDGLNGEYLELVPAIQEAERLFLFTSDRIEIVKQDSIENTILAIDDLNIRKIIDVELINEKLYILSPQQLTSILIGDLIHGSFHISEKYPVAQSERANLSFVAGKLFIESEDHVSFINPTSFLEQKIEQEIEPSFTIEQAKNDLFVYDQSGSTLPSKLRYQNTNGDWEVIDDHAIDLKSLKGSRKEVIIQKMNAYGEWIPQKPEPIYVASQQNPFKFIWIILAVIMLSIVVSLLLKRNQ